MKEKHIGRNESKEIKTTDRQLKQNSYSHRTSYLLSRLVVCDHCGHHYLGTSAKSGRYNTYLQKGRAACNAALLNKEKLETAVLDQIQEQILMKKISASISSLFSSRLASPT